MVKSVEALEVELVALSEQLTAPKKDVPLLRVAHADHGRGMPMLQMTSARYLT